MAGGDVIVVGAGVVGCAVAHSLARRGVSVLVLEQDRPAAHASGAAAGMLAPFTESLGKGPLLSIGARALEQLPEVVEEVREVSGIDPGLVTSGILRLATEDEVSAMRKHAAKLASYGVEWIDRREIDRRMRGVSPEVVGALWSPREGHLHPGLLTQALAGAAIRRGAGLEVGLRVHSLWREGDRVRGVRTADGNRAAAHVVICAGAWSRLFEGGLGVEIPVEPVRGQLVELAGSSRASSPILWGRKAYLVSRPDGTMVVGATVERVGFDARTTAAGVEALLASARTLFPEAADYRFCRARAGLRPATPDHIPLVGPVPDVAGAWLATGHYRNGILLAALSGELIAERIAGGTITADLGVLDPARFHL